MAKKQLCLAIIFSIIFTLTVSMGMVNAADFNTAVYNSVVMVVGEKNAIAKNDIKRLNQEPIIENGVTLVPVRFIAEAFDATVQWDEATQIVSIITKNKYVQMKVGSINYTINGVAYQLPTAPVIYNGTTMLPLRAFAEQVMGLKVFWDDSNKLIVINRSINLKSEDIDVMTKMVSAIQTGILPKIEVARPDPIIPVTTNYDNGTVGKLKIVAYEASAEPEPANPGRNAFDGNKNTRWSADGQPYIVFELTEVKTITEIRTLWWKSSNPNRTTKFDVELSADRSNWTKVFSGESNTGSDFDIIKVNPAQRAKYVRVNGYGNSDNEWNSLLEIEIYGSPADATTTTTVARANGYEIVGVEASSEPEESNPAVNAYDGDLSTRWSASGDGEYIIFDLGEVKPINKIRLAWWLGSSNSPRTTRYDILVSTDKVNWEEVLMGQQSDPAKGNNYEDKVLSKEYRARYVKVVGHMNSENEWNSLLEIEIHGPGTTTTTTTTTVSRVNGYEIVNVEASSEPEESNPAVNACDGDLSTRWSASGDGEYIIFDLGEVKPINKIRLAWWLGSSNSPRTTRYDILVSTDKVNWEEVLMGQQSDPAKGNNYEDKVLSKEYRARYVKVVGHMNSENEWNSLLEIEIHGTK